MNKIKAFFLSLLAVIFFAFGFTACGDTGLAGTYKFSYLSTTVEGQTILVYAGDEYEGVVLDEDLITIVLKDDGTVKLSMNPPEGEAFTETGTWEQGEGNTVIFTIDEYPQEIIVEDGKITFDFYGQGLLTLEKD